MPDEDHGSQSAAEPQTPEPPPQPPDPAGSREVEFSWRSTGLDVIDASTPTGDRFRPELDAPGEAVDTSVQAMDTSVDATGDAADAGGAGE